MSYLVGIETPTLITILRAQVDFYKSLCQPGQVCDCRAMIIQLQNEIASRGVAIESVDKPLFDTLLDLKPVL